MREESTLGGSKRWVFLLFKIVGACMVGLVLVVLYWTQAFYQNGPLEVPSIITIPPGSSLEKVATLLEDRKLIRGSFSFRLMVFMQGHARHLKAGRYQIPPHATAAAITETLVEGKTLLSKVTVPEGMTNQQIVAILRAHPDVVASPFTMPSEGTLFPETYSFSPGTSLSALLDKMQGVMRQEVQKLWARRPMNHPLRTPEEVVILASIVEREAKLHQERPRIAQVFLTRLRKGMALQADPTIIYSVSNGKGILGRPLSKKDLQAPDPFNTYLNKGLPPSPISNPSRSSLEAVFFPSPTKDLFFVTDGNGGHLFSQKLSQHATKVKQYRKRKREIAAQKEKE